MSMFLEIYAGVCLTLAVITLAVHVFCTHRARKEDSIRHSIKDRFLNDQDLEQQEGL